MKVLLIGGHLTPALSLIEYAQKEKLDVDFIYLGRKFSQKNNKQRSVEKQEIDQLGVKFLYFDSISSFNLNLFNFLPKLFNLAQAMIRAGRILSHKRPDLVISFGGYLSVPIVYAAKILKIPSVSHEQTRTIGLANRITLPVVEKLALGMPHKNYDYLDKKNIKKAVYIGNFLRSSLFHSGKDVVDKDLLDFIKNCQKRKDQIIFIAGGNQGSKVINLFIRDNLQSLLSEFALIHACGNPLANLNYQHELETSCDKLKPALRDKYYVKSWFSSQYLGYIYQHSDAGLLRSGASTINEIMAFRLPSLFIPLPQAKFQEQKKNAQFIVDHNAGLKLSQSELNLEKVIVSLKELIKNKNKYRKNLSKIDFTTKSHYRMYQLVKQVYDQKKKSR